jgi:two-component system, OmpR family, sensor histidine kinase KdpD
MQSGQKPGAISLAARAGHGSPPRATPPGPGIPKAHRNRVFLPFQQLGDPGDRTSVGLGLVVSRGLAEAMGGTVEPEETPGGGLTMVVSLPAACGQSAAEFGGARQIRAA